MLENLTAGYKYPCVIDLKMGTKAWDEEVHTDLQIKWRKIKVRATTSADFGFRLGGLRVMFSLVLLVFFRSLFIDSLHGRSTGQLSKIIWFANRATEIA